MAINLSDNFVKEYNSTLQILTQLHGNKFRGKCREESINGEEAYYDQLGNTVATVRSTQFPDSIESSITHDRRKVIATAYENGLFIDRIEKVQTLVNPEGPYVNQQVTAINRKRDQEFFKAALGTAATGKTGAGTAPVTDCPLIPVGTGGTGNQGMNLEKLIETLSALEASGVDVEDPMHKPYFVWSPKQKNELLKNTQVTSSDYAAVKALVTGQIDTFYGFEFITSTLVPYMETGLATPELTWSATTDAPVDTDTTGVRSCFAYTRDNVLMATNPEITSKISERPDKSYDWYAYAVARFGGVRMQETNTVLVPCDESP